MINLDFFKTPGGILKLANTVIGIVCFALITIFCIDNNMFLGDSAHTFFLIVSFAFLLTTSLLLVSSLVSTDSAVTLPKTLFELLYHVLGFIFYIAASIALIISAKKGKIYFTASENKGNMTAGVFGLLNSVVYLGGAFLSFRNYRSD